MLETDLSMLASEFSRKLLLEKINILKHEIKFMFKIFRVLSDYDNRCNELISIIARLPSIDSEATFLMAEETMSQIFEYLKKHKFQIVINKNLKNFGYHKKIKTTEISDYKLMESDVFRCIKYHADGINWDVEQNRRELLKKLSISFDEIDRLSKSLNVENYEIFDKLADGLTVDEIEHNLNDDGMFVI